MRLHLTHQGIIGGDEKEEDCPDCSEKSWQNSGHTTEVDGHILKSILDAIGTGALTSKIDLPIDSARASFLIQAVIVPSSQEFTEITTSFYVKLISSTASMPAAENHFAEAGAIELIEKAFSKNGGVSGAVSEALHGYHGGIRRVLDKMTEQYQSECREKEVRRVLKTSLDPLDWGSKVNIASQLLKKMGHHLPDEIMNEPPEKFARHWEEIVSSYAQSVNQVKAGFRLF